MTYPPEDGKDWSPIYQGVPQPGAEWQKITVSLSMPVSWDNARIMRTGAARRDLPPDYGVWSNTRVWSNTHRRFIARSDRGSREKRRIHLTSEEMLNG